MCACMSEQILNRKKAKETADYPSTHHPKYTNKKGIDCFLLPMRLSRDDRRRGVVHLTQSCKISVRPALCMTLPKLQLC